MNQPEKPFIYNYNQVQAPGTDRPEVTLIAERTCVHRFSLGAGAQLPRRSAGPGGARRIRTDDILLAKQALYQLSYGPLVGPTRFELVTSRLSSVRSNQLSYGPKGRKRMVSQTLAYDA